ncbi:MAG TPA: hypothetical protein VN238_21245 [Solirubrobacteraceae bacterium]|nr:hypothetical protein [Solirubrobacteraceae bacterium]
MNETSARVAGLRQLLRTSRTPVFVPDDDHGPWHVESVGTHRLDNADVLSSVGISSESAGESAELSVVTQRRDLVYRNWADGGPLPPAVVAEALRSNATTLLLQRSVERTGERNDDAADAFTARRAAVAVWTTESMRIDGVSHTVSTTSLGEDRVLCADLQDRNVVVIGITCKATVAVRELPPEALDDRLRL